jgi:hypothetical protein
VKTHAVIETYVLDVIRGVPARDRDEIGFELRGLLTEMLADRAESAGCAADDEMVLEMLREFGTPAEIAARYQVPGIVIIPAEGTRSFAIVSLGGVALQWALTLPAVFLGKMPLVQWWFGWGLGALWWPGFMVTMSLLAAWFGQLRAAKPKWQPRAIDSDRVHRAALAFGLVCYVIGASLVTALPWIFGALPQPMPQVFAFAPDFLHERAPAALLLWLAGFVSLVSVLHEGRWTPLTRRFALAFSMAWICLLSWWLAAGDIFLAKATNEGARGALALVIVLIAIDLFVQLYRQRIRIRAPKAAG